MKVTVERGALLKALGHAASVVERRNTIPVLSNVLIEAAGEEARLTATDLELQISIPVPASVAEDGATTVQAALLLGIVRELPDGAQVELSTDPENSRLNVAAASSRYRLAQLPASEFPVLQPAEDAVEFTMPPTALKEMLAKVAHAMSSDPARYFLNGASLESHAGGMFLVATDGFCIGSASIEAPEGATELPPAIIPRKTVSALEGLLGDAEAELAIAVTTKQLRVTVDEIDLTSKLIDGNFPEWRRAVPSSNPHLLQVHADALAAAVRRAVVVSTDKVRSVVIELGGDKLTVKGTSHEHGEGAEEVQVAWEGPELTMRLNARYLTDTMAAMAGPEVEARFADPRAPILFINPADKAAQWVVMPMSV